MPPAKTEPTQIAAEESFDLTVAEYCARLSNGDSRVELIGAFYATEKQAGRWKDSAANFDERFNAFCNAPA